MTKAIHAAVFLVLGWSTPIEIPQARAAEPLRVAVSIAPQKYFLERIGGNRIETSVMVPPGASPETYALSPLQMKGLTGSVLYFAIGAPFERAWLKKLAQINPDMTIVSTEAGIEKLPMDHVRHSHGDGSGAALDARETKTDGQGTGGKDPHIWLPPPHVMLRARNILAARLKTDPDGAYAYESNYRVFMRELVHLDLEINGMFSGKAARSRFLVFHPAWGYFAKAYGLTQVAIEKEGKPPSAKELARITRAADELRIKVIFVQPQFSIKSAQSIADAIGGKVVTADPLSADWAANLRLVASQFRDAAR